MAIRLARDAALRLRPPEEPAPVEVTLYHDVLCSWCYLADARLESLRDEYGNALKWSLRPYPLRPESQLPGKKERQIQPPHHRKRSETLIVVTSICVDCAGMIMN